MVFNVLVLLVVSTMQLSAAVPQFRSTPYNSAEIAMRTTSDPGLMMTVQNLLQQNSQYANEYYQHLQESPISDYAMQNAHAQQQQIDNKYRILDQEGLPGYVCLRRVCCINMGNNSTRPRLADIRSNIGKVTNTNLSDISISTQNNRTDCITISIRHNSEPSTEQGTSNNFNNRVGNQNSPVYPEVYNEMVHRINILENRLRNMAAQTQVSSGVNESAYHSNSNEFETQREQNFTNSILKNVSNTQEIPNCIKMLLHNKINIYNNYRRNDTNENLPSQNDSLVEISQLNLFSANNAKENLPPRVPDAPTILGITQPTVVDIVTLNSNIPNDNDDITTANRLLFNSIQNKTRNRAEPVVVLENMNGRSSSSTEFNTENQATAQANTLTLNSIQNNTKNRAEPLEFPENLKGRTTSATQFDIVNQETTTTNSLSLNSIQNNMKNSAVPLEVPENVKVKTTSDRHLPIVTSTESNFRDLQNSEVTTENVRVHSTLTNDSPRNITNKNVEISKDFNNTLIKSSRSGEPIELINIVNTKENKITGVDATNRNNNVVDATKVKTNNTKSSSNTMISGMRPNVLKEPRTNENSQNREHFNLNRFKSKNVDNTDQVTNGAQHHERRMKVTPAVCSNSGHNSRPNPRTNPRPKSRKLKPSHGIPILYEINAFIPSANAEEKPYDKNYYADIRTTARIKPQKQRTPTTIYLHNIIKHRPDPTAQNTGIKSNTNAFSPFGGNDESYEHDHMDDSPELESHSDSVWDPCESKDMDDDLSYSRDRREERYSGSRDFT